MRTLLTALVVFLLTAGTAGAQCRDHPDMLAELQKRYKEVPVALGISDGAQTIEILASPLGTFTIIRVLISGLACVIEEGHSFEMVSPPLGQPT